ncbi:MAG: acyl-CoA dehydrogenase family protein [Deltaproteobacteria bacterium]|nr:acyl-CoA dehydrogenase family protein [Deltaproteobacteria bacterium]
MNFDFTEEEKQFRQEVEDFAKTELPADWDEKALYWPAGYGTLPGLEKEFKEFHDELLLKLGRKGWLTIGWPEEYGGMNSMIKHAIFDDVMSYHRAPGGDVSNAIAGPTILLVGSDDLKKEWLPRIGRGELRFWLGYSEPNAGSDLASIKTRAVDNGDEFILNGQKIWSSGAHIADYAWVLAKTDPDAPRYAGETLMIVDNKSPGITIRPIENICGICSFNEVFFDDVRVPKKNIVGEVNKGFYCVMMALLYERLFVGIGAFRRVLDELVEFAKETEHNGQPLAKDPLTRDKLAAMAIEIEILYGFYWKTAWLMDKGQVPVLEASVLKLFGTELGRKLAGAAMEILGMYGQLKRGSKWAPLRGLVSLGYMDSVSGPIGAGTSEVQRGIIATRGLGLPRK